MDEYKQLIDSADEAQLTEIIRHLIQRFERDHPGHEFLFCSLPNNPEERMQSIQRLASFLAREPLPYDPE